MRQDDWSKLSPFLDRALEMEPAARERWLAEISAEHPAVEQELRALLAEDQELEGRGFLDGGLYADLFGPMPSLAGQRVGAWVLERPIGHGGMGTVWLARRDDGRFEGKAAVKLLNISLLGRSGEARFRREGTLLARLSHPGIARLLDAGLTPSGQPYLVLEYIEGDRIDQYCDQRQLTPAARLSLFQQVLDAVAHAHASLVVHRDLKPSNILVTPDGTVKLLDFGIGKLTEGDSDESESIEHGHNALTPEYASPEQVQGDDVTTATDIYSLGVLLYLLLTGRHPTGSNSRSPVEHIASIVQREPPPASDAVIATAMAAGPEADKNARAAARGSTPERLRRLYRGDLDNILSKALRKTPSERYASVTALAEDLQRYERHEPVGARADALLYRARKFVRRNRGAVLAGSLMAVALMGATLVTTRQMLVARQQRDKAVFERKRAEAATGFLSSLLSAIGKDGKPLTLHEMLDRGVTMLAEQYGNDPALGARMLLDFSGRYVDIGDEAKKDLVMARAESLSALSGDHDLYSGILCARGEDRAREGDLPGAKALLARADSEMARVTDRGSRFGFACRYAQALVARVEGRSDTAIALMKGIVSVIRSEGDTNSSSYWSNLNELGIHLATAGRVRESYEAFNDSYRALSRTGRMNTATALVVRHNLADAAARMGEFVRADSVVRDLIPRWRSVDTSGAGPASLRTAARLSWSLARYDSAVAYYEQALAMEGRPGSEDIMRIVRAELAQVRVEQGRLNDAHTLLAWLEHSTLRQAPSSARVVRARILRAEGKPDSALALSTDILARADYPGKPPTFTHLIILLFGGNCALEAKKLDVAQSYANAALDVARQNARGPETSGYVGDALLLSAQIQLARGDRAAARDRAREAIPSLMNGYGTDHPSTISARALLASLQAVP